MTNPRSHFKTSHTLNQKRHIFEKVVTLTHKPSNLQNNGLLLLQGNEEIIIKSKFDVINANGSNMQ